ncbi:cytochrome P450 [Streptomyces sp. DT2A-34]|uniref:cytochrome P450 n=1 Tax=Streptomyces sp. DT2A-34 TaxID=3051182 RepID=UPI00265BA654|nr:cytochrome P450 [Streptomyces sp. DT2A-34]MDO0910974.1 cytochrome P450 [Streptomyces sp. DT2A-34]
MTSTITAPLVPTAPRALPGIGHALQLLCNPLPFTTSLNELGPVVRVLVPGPDVYLVTAPDLLHRILVTETRDYAKGRITEGIGSQFGPSVVMDMSFEGLTHFESHRRHRRAVQPGFNPHRIAAQTQAAHLAVQEQLARWRPGQTLRIDKELARLAYQINARAFCGNGPTTQSVADALAGLVAQTTPGLLWRVSLPQWAHLSHVPGTGAFNRALTRLRTAIHATIDIRRRDTQDSPDVLSHLLQATYADTGERLDDHQIVSETLFYLFAAVHGIGDAMPYAFHQLALNPQVEQRVHEEIDAVLDGRPVQAEDLPRLDYTRRVLQEVLRLHPPVWVFARRTLVPVQLGSAHLPAGAEIVISPYGLHRNPQVHQDPLRFDPDRWLPERAKSLAPCTYLALGAGPRKCIGDNLAMTNMLTLLATIASRWRLRTVPTRRVRPITRIFLSPGPLPMICEPRSVA